MEIRFFGGSRLLVVEIAEIQVNHIYIFKYSRGKVFSSQPVCQYGLLKLRIMPFQKIILILAEEMWWKIKNKKKLKTKSG